MQYGQRKLHVSITDTRRSRSARAAVSTTPVTRRVLQRRRADGGEQLDHRAGFGHAHAARAQRLARIGRLVVVQQAA
jgi:hypothetical protein